MKLRYIYSACVVVHTEDCAILADPWFTPGAYDGSWYQYPHIEDPVSTIGPVDLIYVSHIHPDHYDPTFLHQYLRAFPTARLLIGAQTPAYLAAKMRLDGLKPEVADRMRIGETELLIVPNRGPEGGGTEIDTALVVRRRAQSIANMNDNPFVLRQVEQVLEFCPGGRPDLALLPYCGAGPYPQTFAFNDPADLLKAAEEKKRQFIDLFSRYLEALKPRKALPFAGKYYLGGRLASLNALRGLADATEVASLFGDAVVVLADGGKATFDLDTSQASEVRRGPYDERDVNAFLASLNIRDYSYEREIRPDAGHSLPFLPLLTTSKRRARSKVTLSGEFWLIIRPESLDRLFVLNLCDDAAPTVERSNWPTMHLSPRLEITIDHRYLFGLLTRLYHWNNAEVGSQYRSLRVPDTYREDVYEFMNMFQV